MTAASIGAGRGAGYAQYLEGKTVAPERGDYYLTPDGELTEAPGRWLCDPETLARLARHGLIENAWTQGRKNVWQLTASGEQLEKAIRHDTPDLAGDGPHGEQAHAA